MAQDSYPTDPKTRVYFRNIENKTVHAASRSVFVTPGALRVYRERYPNLPEERFAVIENGYEEEAFEQLPRTEQLKPLSPGARTLLHSGVVYQSERDPTRFFEAIRNMLDAGQLRRDELRVRLRAPVHESFLNGLIQHFKLGDIVEIAPPIPYRKALSEMLRADGLLVLQAANCNDQIPAKAYEYLRCRRPIVALTDPAGDTASLLLRSGGATIARLDSAADIATGLRKFLDCGAREEGSIPDSVFVTHASRLSRTRELADLLDRLPTQFRR